MYDNIFICTIKKMYKTLIYIRFKKEHIRLWTDIEYIKVRKNLTIIVFYFSFFVMILWLVIPPNSKFRTQNSKFFPAKESRRAGTAEYVTKDKW